MQDLKPAGF